MSRPFTETLTEGQTTSGANITTLSNSAVSTERPVDTR